MLSEYSVIFKEICEESKKRLEQRDVLLAELKRLINGYEQCSTSELIRRFQTAKQTVIKIEGNHE